MFLSEKEKKYSLKLSAHGDRTRCNRDPVNLICNHGTSARSMCQEIVVGHKRFHSLFLNRYVCMQVDTHPVTNSI